MKVITAKTAGFCFGVKRAVEKVYEQVNQEKKEIYTYGPIIHNEEVVADLESKGVKVLESREELEKLVVTDSEKKAFAYFTVYHPKLKELPFVILKSIENYTGISIYDVDQSE